MDLHKLALVTHILGVVLWIGGTLAASIAALGALTDHEGGEGGEGEGSKGADGHLKVGLKAASRVNSVLANPGLALAWIGGLSMLIPNFTALYARAGWMHGKLTLALIASALTGILGARLKKAVRGDKPIARGLLMGVATGAGLIALLALILVIFHPGG
jgi:uncharacterized membrane protein